MPVPSLKELCMRACMKNVANLRDVGTFEYWQIRPVLLRITNAEQLHRIELACPQILGEDAEVWKALMARDIPTTKMRKDLKPEDPLKWWELYSECLAEQKEAIARDTEVLREAMMGLQRQKESNVSRIVDSKHLPQQPMDPGMRSNYGGVPISLRDWKRDHGVKKRPVARVWTGLKTKITGGASVLTRARREAAVISSRTRPSQSVWTGTSRVTRAPTSMVEAYRKTAIPERMIHPAVKKSASITGAQSLLEREKRLLALKSGSSVAKPITKDEGSSGDEFDDLFGEEIFPPVSSPSTPPKDARPANVISEIFNRKEKRSLPIKTAAGSKPSDIISSITSKPSTITVPKPRPSAPAQNAASPASSSSRSGSPASAKSPGATPPPGRLSMAPPLRMPMKRKPEVDIFNRTGTASKRPRMK